MRLIDADALKEKLSDFEVRGGHKYYRQGMDVCLHECFPAIIDDRPTIDPENLSIVQQLRDELKRAVIERNTLAAIVYQKCNKDCFSYNNGVIKANSGCGYFNNLTRKCMLQEWTGCKNASENVRLKEPEDYFFAKAKEGKV